MEYQPFCLTPVSRCSDVIGALATWDCDDTRHRFRRVAVWSPRMRLLMCATRGRCTRCSPRSRGLAVHGESPAEHLEAQVGPDPRGGFQSDDRRPHTKRKKKTMDKQEGRPRLTVQCRRLTAHSSYAGQPTPHTESQVGGTGPLPSTQCPPPHGPARSPQPRRTMMIGCDSGQ